MVERRTQPGCRITLLQFGKPETGCTLAPPPLTIARGERKQAWSNGAIEKCGRARTQDGQSRYRKERKGGKRVTGAHYDIDEKSTPPAARKKNPQKRTDHYWFLSAIPPKNPKVEASKRRKIGACGKKLSVLH